MIRSPSASSCADRACLGSMNHFTMMPMNRACRTEPAVRAGSGSPGRVDTEEELGQPRRRVALDAGQERAQLLVPLHQAHELQLRGP